MIKKLTFYKSLLNITIIKKVFSLTLAIHLISNTVSAETKTYIVDPVNSSLTFKIKHLKKFTVNGEFNVFNGKVELNEDNIVDITGEIDSRSINTNNRTRDRHLNSKDFLNTKKYPQILFTYLNADKETINGIIDLHGVTKNITIPYSINPSQNNLIISSEFQLNRFDFDIRKHKRMVGKEVTVFLNLLLKPITN